ncbi:MAG: DoxX family protein [Candidatus Babeliales bacterium]
MNLYAIISATTLHQLNLGLAIIRIGIGILFIRHGFPKLKNGIPEWQWLGDQMQFFGITFMPVFWGFLAACAEFFGGVFLTLGIGTRIAAFFIACVMTAAINMHWHKGDPWGYISHPIALLIIMIGLMVAGGGSYSLEQYL